MLLLDENMPAGQRLLLREWRIRFRAVDIEVVRVHADGAHFRQMGNPALQSVRWRNA